MDHDQPLVVAEDDGVHVMSVPSWSVYASGPAMGEPSVGTRNSAHRETRLTLHACSLEAFSSSWSLPKA